VFIVLLLVVLAVGLAELHEDDEITHNLTGDLKINPEIKMEIKPEI
jgi:hypothetical protein